MRSGRWSTALVKPCSEITWPHAPVTVCGPSSCNAPPPLRRQDCARGLDVLLMYACADSFASCTTSGSVTLTF